MEIYVRICESLVFLQEKGSTDYSTNVFPAVEAWGPYVVITLIDEPCNTF